MLAESYADGSGGNGEDETEKNVIRGAGFAEEIR